MKDVLVVLPVYKSRISPFELISLQQCIKILHQHPMALIAPEGLNLEKYYSQNKDFKEHRFSPRFFTGIPAYNRMLMSSFFYKTFLDYKYILIYQLDAFVFKDELLFWCNKGYDYVGAPWMDPYWIVNLKKKLYFKFLQKKVNAVGNGGLSLRRTRAFYSNAKVFSPLALAWPYNEDFFWSSAVNSLNPLFKVAPFREAMSFAFEDKPAQLLDLNQGHLPFGCHAWEKYDLNFWLPYLKKQGYAI